jgi:hypothetical protein
MIPQAALGDQTNGTPPAPETVHSKAVVGVGGFVGGFLFVIIAIVVGLVHLWAGRQNISKSVALNAPESPFVVLPPAPRLEVSPPSDLAAQIEEQRELLNSYGVGPDGAKRIPIERAMERVAAGASKGAP